MPATRKPTVNERVTVLEGCYAHLDDSLDEVKEDLKELTRSHNEVHSVVTDGLKDSVRDLKDEVSELRKSRPQKKPRRLELLLAIIAILSFSQAVGLLDGIRLAIGQWLTGGTG